MSENHSDGKSKDYFVFYNRDMSTEKTKKYNGKMLYDDAKRFGSKDKAYDFAHNNLPALVMKKIKGPQDAKEYLVAARFEGKYMHYDYSGDSDALTNYDILRVEKSQLEETIEKFSCEKNFKEVILGIEEKIF